MQSGQPIERKLAGPAKMPEIGAGMGAACETVACGIDRTVVSLELGVP